MMYVATKDLAGARVITILVDVIQITNYEEVFNKIRSVISEEHNLVVLDMEKVKFMDSFSLGMLVPVKLYAKRLGGEMVIASPNEKIRDLLHVLRLDSIIHIEHKLEKAVDQVVHGDLSGGVLKK